MEEIQLSEEEMLNRLVSALGGVLTHIPLYLYEQDRHGMLQEAVDVYQQALGLKKQAERGKSRFF